MLPGLTRTPAQPASMAANTYLGWKWISAMTGIWDLPAMIGRAAASSAVGQATRTISQPAAVSSAICCSVPLMSVVCVVVIDCTLTGESDPTPTFPTLICLVFLRGASTGGGGAGIPRLTDVTKDPFSRAGDQPQCPSRRRCGTRIVRTITIVGPPTDTRLSVRRTQPEPNHGPTRTADAPHQPRRPCLRPTVV